MFDDEEFKPETLEEQLEHLILASSCLSALRLLRMRREGASVATLVNSRPKGSVLPSWESDVVEMLSGCNIGKPTWLCSLDLCFHFLHRRWENKSNKGRGNCGSLRNLGNQWGQGPAVQHARSSCGLVSRVLPLQP